MVQKFKVGDQVVGNAQASHEYGVTVRGWRGTVERVIDAHRIAVVNKKDGEFEVLKRCFDKVKDVATPKRKAPVAKPKTCSVPVDFIKKAYEAADLAWKGRLAKQFPELFTPTHRIQTGQKYRRTAKDIYLLIHVGEGKVELVSLITANRWNDPVKVADLSNITLKEWEKITAGEAGDFKLITSPK